MNIEPNFNINCDVSKAVKEINDGSNFRRWSYTILAIAMGFLCVFALFWKGGDIASGVADLVRALQGR